MKQVLSFLGIIFFAIGLQFIGRQAGRVSAKRDASAEVAREAASAMGPPGLLGTTWLMTAAEVKKTRPQVTAQGKDLVEYTQLYDRAAEIRYNFIEDSLLLIIVTFQGASSDSEFSTVQHRLETDYGAMPTPGPAEKYKLSSEKAIGRFRVHHILQDILVPVEQILLYRTASNA